MFSTCHNRTVFAKIIVSYKNDGKKIRNFIISMAMNYVIMRKLCLILSSLELDLSGNKLNQFPADMHVMQGIQVLNLSGNDLESVPPFVYSLPNLQELHLQNNCLMGKKLRANCIKSSIPKVFTIIEACINL